MSLLSQRHIIIGEALKFSLGRDEEWGLATNKDLSFGHFIHTLKELSLYDIEPMNFNIRNMRSSKGRIAKCLRIFLVRDSLVNDSVQIK
jgi:hypothetical protein